MAELLEDSRRERLGHQTVTCFYQQVGLLRTDVSYREPMSARMPQMANCDALPDGVLSADRDGRVTMLNLAAARMLGVGRDTALGRPLTEVLRLQNADGIAWTTAVLPYGGLATRSGIPEQSWLLPDGREVLVTARLQRDGRRGPVTDLGICLRSARGRARLDRERSDLVATVAHELRSPLTGVKGFVQALLNQWDRLSDEQKKLMLTTVNADADRLSRLIAELLDVARIDTGRLSLYTRPVSPATLLGRVVDSVKAGTARVIHFEPPAQLPEIQADPDKFTQVMTNLLENAVRHGEGVVTVSVDPFHGPSWAGVRVRVDDEGGGIAPEIRQRVFTKFWTAGTRGGSGLGMYIAHGLAKAHGGTVDIDDVPGGGARIEVRWPGPQPDVEPAVKDGEGHRQTGSPSVLVSRTASSAQ
jgi:signal transduction histidine kinase